MQALLNFLLEIQKLIAVKFHLPHIAPSITYSAVLICKGDSAEKVISGSRHHDMSRPQVADGGTACNMEGSCEYTE